MGFRHSSKMVMTEAFAFLNGCWYACQHFLNPGPCDLGSGLSVENLWMES